MKDSDNKTAADSVSNENSSSVNVQIKKPINEPPTSDSINMDVDSLVIEETQTPSTDNASQELFSAGSSDLTSDDDMESYTNMASSDLVSSSKRPLSSSLAYQNPQNALCPTAPWMPFLQNKISDPFSFICRMQSCVRPGHTSWS